MFSRLIGILLLCVAAQAATITATSSQNSYAAGSSVSVDIAVSDVVDLYGFQLDVLFDPAILSLMSVEEAGYFLSNGVSFSPGFIDNTAGSVRFIADALRGASAFFTGSTTLATLSFAAAGLGTTDIAPSNIILLDSQLTDISASATSASIRVLDTTSVPEAGSWEMVAAGMLVLGLLLDGSGTQLGFKVQSRSTNAERTEG